MKEKLSRLLSLVMTFIMLFGLMPTQALADAVVGEWVTGTGEIGTYAAIPNVISDASKISLRGDAFTVPVYYYDKDTSEILTSETFSVDDKDGVVVDKQLNSYTGKRGNAKLAKGISDSGYSVYSVSRKKKDSSYNIRYKVSSDKDWSTMLFTYPSR